MASQTFGNRTGNARKQSSVSTALDERSFRSIGRSVPRREDARLLTGRGRFSDDFNLPGQLHAAMVRSLHPHARILGVHTGEARTMPGVAAVFTGGDCAADGLETIPHSPVPSTRTDLKLTAPDGGPIFVGPHAVLPQDKVRHVGEALAMVVAETREQAVDASEAVYVDYEPLPWVTDSVAAAASASPSVWEQVPDNVCCDTTFGDTEATAAAFAGADHVLGMTFRIGRITGVPLEPRAALAAFDPDSGRYTTLRGQQRCGAPQAPDCRRRWERIPMRCASFASMSAATSVPRTGCTPSTASPFGPPGDSVGRSSTPHPDPSLS